MNYSRNFRSAAIICVLFALCSCQVILEVEHSESDILNGNPFHKTVKETPHIFMSYVNRHNANKPMLPPVLHPDYFQKIFLSLLMSVAMEENRIRIRDREEKLHKNPLDIIKNYRRNKLLKNKENLIETKEVCSFCNEFCKMNTHATINANATANTTFKANVTTTSFIGFNLTNNANTSAITKSSPKNYTVPSLNETSEQRLNISNLFTEEMKIKTSTQRGHVNNLFAEEIKIRTARAMNKNNELHINLTSTFFDSTITNIGHVTTNVKEQTVSSKTSDKKETTVEIMKEMEIRTTEQPVKIFHTKNVSGKKPEVSTLTNDNKSGFKSANILKTIEMSNYAPATKTGLKHKKDILTNFILSARANENINRKRRNKFTENVDLMNVNTGDELEYLFGNEHKPRNELYEDKVRADAPNQKYSLLQPLFFDVKKDVPISVKENTPKPTAEKENYRRSILVTLPTIIFIGVVSFIIYFVIKSCYSLAKQSRPAQSNVETGNVHIPVPQK